MPEEKNYQIIHPNDGSQKDGTYNAYIEGDGCGDCDGTGGGTPQSLNNVLGVGNQTGGRNIRVNSGDSVQGTNELKLESTGTNSIILKPVDATIDNAHVQIGGNTKATIDMYTEFGGIALRGGSIDVTQEDGLKIIGDNKITIDATNAGSRSIDLVADTDITLDSGQNINLQQTTNINDSLYVGTSNTANTVSIKAVNNLGLESSNLYLNGQKFPEGDYFEGAVLTIDDFGEMYWGSGLGGTEFPGTELPSSDFPEVPTLEEVLIAGNDANYNSIEGVYSLNSPVGSSLGISASSTLQLTGSVQTTMAGPKLNIQSETHITDDLFVGASATALNIDLQSTNILLNGTKWPLAGTGAEGDILERDALGHLQWTTNATTVLSLAQALNNGQETGGKDVRVSIGDKITGEPANQLGVDGGDLILTGGLSLDSNDGSVIISDLVYPNVDGDAGDVLTTDGNGNLILSSIPSTNYIQAYDDTIQVIPLPNTWQSVPFNNVSEGNGWTHVGNTSVFTCPKTGTYEVAYNAHVARTANPIQDVAFKLEVNNVLVEGSYFGTSISRRNETQNLNKSVFVTLAVGDAVVLSVISEDTSTILKPMTLLGGITSAPSVSLNIKEV